ncbi:DNA cytosine methyltransferase [Rickettsia endosymbiont of Nabis limbatus]|uniref:DNA cytosine methyltransferase n=1 Tax=Rickettsia endosymbiont of Nabis limbatus TaxID=3066268 RepID=UPI003AF3EE2F
MKDKSNLTLISLFAGAGGMDIGFKKAGFKTIWANEYDKTITPSYRSYFPDTKIDERSILNVPNEDIPQKITGIIGGPPCQSWSEAGAKRGLEDPRGLIFHEQIRIIRYVKPKFFVAENVHGIIHSRNIKSFMNIIDMFKQEGYEVSWKLLKASDYGVPQDRERVFIIGYHQSLNKKFQFPEPLKTKVNLNQAIGDLANLEIGTTNSINNHEFLDTGYSPIFMSRNRVRSWEEQSFTILATYRHIPFHPQAPKMIKIAGQEKRKFVKGQEHTYRRLTIRECARIQTFPDGYKMIGNAVPVELAYHIAKTIKKDLAIIEL